MSVQHDCTEYSGTVQSVASTVKTSGGDRPSIRDAQAAATRARVITAAQELFEHRGYTRTTVNDIADAAGVSTETIYKSLGGKSGLLDAILEAAIAGPGGVPFDEQRALQDIADLPTPTERLRAYVAFCCATLRRTRPVHAIIRSAAETEPRVADLRARQLRVRLTRNARYLDDFVADALRPALTLKEAAEQYCALSSPEMYELLTVQLGWSDRRHERWLAATAHRELLAGD